MKKRNIQLAMTFGFVIIGVIMVGEGNPTYGYWLIGVGGGMNLPGILGLDKEES